MKRKKAYKPTLPKAGYIEDQRAIDFIIKEHCDWLASKSPEERYTNVHESPLGKFAADRRSSLAKKLKLARNHYKEEV